MMKFTFSRMAAAVAPVVVATCGATGNATTTGAPSPHSYYLSNSGSDAGSGTSATSPWASLNKLNAATLKAGDRVLLERGGTWAGRLLITASGTPTRPITLSSYGDAKAALPAITGGVSGACYRLNGSYIMVTALQAHHCSYAGFDFWGSHETLQGSSSSNNAVGVKASTGSNFGIYRGNTLANNNIMNRNTRGTNCGTAAAVNCNDDSGALGFLINSNDNRFTRNTVTGSSAFSYDYGRDGDAFEIFNASRNLITDNVAGDDLVLSELGRSAGGVADDNTYLNNVFTSTCGADCDIAGGMTLRGPSVYGPTRGTVITGNTFRLTGAHSHGIVCGATCPASTVITNNIVVAHQALWMDGTGWTLYGNTLTGLSNVVQQKPPPPTATATTTAGSVTAASASARP